MMTIPEAAKLLRLSRQRVHKLVQDGRIRAKRFGRTWVISEGAIKRFMRRRKW